MFQLAAEGKLKVETVTMPLQEMSNGLKSVVTRWVEPTALEGTATEVSGKDP